MAFTKAQTETDIATMKTKIQEIIDAAIRVRPSKITAWETEKASLVSSSSRNNQRLQLEYIDQLVQDEFYSLAKDEVVGLESLIDSLP